MLGGKRNANKILAGKPDGRRRPLRRRTHRWQDNIKVILRDIRCECLNMIHVAEHKHHWQAFVNAVVNVKLQHQTWEFLNRSAIVSCLHAVAVLDTVLCVTTISSLSDAARGLVDSSFLLHTFLTAETKVKTVPLCITQWFLDTESHIVERRHVLKSTRRVRCA